MLPLASSGPAARPVPVELELRSGETRLDFDGRVTDLLHLEALEGEYRLSGPSLARAGSSLGLTLPTTETFDIEG